MAVIERHAAERVHRVEHAHVNWHVVEEGGRLTVVDWGHPRSWRLLGQLLAALRSTPRDIEAVVLTHGHFDHVGFASRAVRELGVPVHAPADDLAIGRRPWRYPHERSRVRHALGHPPFLRVLGSMARAGAPWVRGVPKAVP